MILLLIYLISVRSSLLTSCMKPLKSSITNHTSSKLSLHTTKMLFCHSSSQNQVLTPQQILECYSTITLSTRLRQRQAMLFLRVTPNHRSKSKYCQMGWYWPKNFREQKSTDRVKSHPTDQQKIFTHFSPGKGVHTQDILNIQKFSNWKATVLITSRQIIWTDISPKEKYKWLIYRN